MNRRNLIKSLTLGGGAFITGSIPDFPAMIPRSHAEKLSGKYIDAHMIIAGGGLGGCAAALAALRNGLKVIMTEETDWIGGQLTQQGLSCPDEHQWIEQFGATEAYRNFRISVREYYKRYYPLISSAKSNKYLDPGDGGVSRLCHEPRVALTVLYNLFAPYLSAGKLILLTQHKIVATDVEKDYVRSLKAKNLLSGSEVVLSAPYFVDATELGDLLPLTGTEYVMGAESKFQTGELHATDKPEPKNQQAFTLCFALGYDKEKNNIIDKPESYDFWKAYIPKLSPPWPGRLFSLDYSYPARKLGLDPSGQPTGHLLNLWNYRRIINPDNFDAGFYDGGVTIVNWPQNDFLMGNLVGVDEKEYERNIRAAEQLNLSLLYWLQTEVSRPDGGQGWPGLKLRGDIMGTDSGFAKFPYIREARRIKSVFTILEEYVGVENRALVVGKEERKHAKFFPDTVGVGYYPIDIHATSTGVNGIPISSMPFQIPLGALLPQRVRNLFPACKNIGTTHITNGCYRLHPVEWNIGESAGLLVSYALKKKLPRHAVREKESSLKDFQNFIRSQGVETHWSKQ